MKGWVKGMLIASAVCIGTGTAMCAGAWAMGGRFSQFRHRRIQETEGEARTQEEVYEQSGSTEITEDRAVAERGIETEKTEAEQSVFRTATYDGADIRKMEIWQSCRGDGIWGRRLQGSSGQDMGTGGSGSFSGFYLRTERYAQ